MNEAEWLTSDDPRRMLECLTADDGWPDGEELARPSGRELRLFKEAVCGMTDIKDIEALMPRPPGWDFWYERMLQLRPAACCSLLRDVVGNPFRPVLTCLGDDNWPPDTDCRCRIDPWLAWNDGCVRKMAQAIYDERAFDRLPILADALEDAGCDDEAILRHLRGEEQLPRCGVQSHDLECETCGVRLYGANVRDVCRRKQGPHVRGCWVLDLLLGLE